MRRLLAMIALAATAALFLWLQLNRGPRYQIDDCAAPKLVPALKRLEQCSPDLYAFVASQPTQFGCTSNNLPVVCDTCALFPESLSIPQLSSEVNQYLLMVTAVHASRLVWQAQSATKWTPEQRAADAYQFGENLFRTCPTTDPQGVQAIRILARRWAALPNSPD